MKWTDTKDRMPKDGTKVLLLLKDGEVRSGFRRVTWLGGFATGRESGQCISNATHWAPFPKTPTVKVLGE